MSVYKTIYAKDGKITWPGNNIHVNGRIKAQGTSTDKSGVLELINNDSSVTNNIFTEGNNHYNFGEFGDLIFQTADSTKNFIFDRGNVGIGTKDPPSRLSVNGKISLGYGLSNSTNSFWTTLKTGPFYGPSIFSSKGTTGGSYPFNAWGHLCLQSRTADDSDIVFATGGAPTVSMVIDGTGNVGIGTTNPGYPLHIFGYTLFPPPPPNPGHTNLLFASYSRGWGWYGYHNLTNDHDEGRTAKIHLKTEGTIWVNNGAYLATSDERIKTNIVDISDNLALEMLRNIPCYYYNYKDKSSGIGKTIGFLAQEVKNIVPMAVSIQKGTIPNEMRIIETPQWTEINDVSNNKFKLTISDLEDVSGNTKYKFYVSNDISGNDETQKEIHSLEDEPNSFIFDQSWNNVFLYGKEVDDFHTLDKQKLFALNFSATQEIDRIQQQQLLDISGNSLAIGINKNELELLKLENQELTNKVTSLETELNNLRTIVESLVNNN